ncbi:hypothetical protein HPP92_013373 [Vanilla planifolia]|nr:hypothetical protein HPP92_013373 [Vanilla planifolia]
MSAPIWVACPDYLFVSLGLSNLIRVASTIGEPLQIDGWTSGMERTSFARICIRANLAKPLRPGIWLNSSNGRIFQRFEYEGLPRSVLNSGRALSLRVCKRFSGKTK